MLETLAITLIVAWINPPGKHLERSLHLFVKGVRPKFNLERGVHLFVEKHIKAISVHLFVNIK